MIEVKIVNKIAEKIEEYQNNTGATKTWISKQLGYKSRQSLDGAIISKNPTIETIAKFAKFLHCDIKDLYEVEYYNSKT